MAPTARRAPRAAPRGLACAREVWHSCALCCVTGCVKMQAAASLGHLVDCPYLYLESQQHSNEPLRFASNALTPTLPRKTWRYRSALKVTISSRAHRRPLFFLQIRCLLTKTIPLT